jgi:hypothetical protein
MGMYGTWEEMKSVLNVMIKVRENNFRKLSHVLQDFLGASSS